MKTLFKSILMLGLFGSAVACETEEPNSANSASIVISAGEHTASTVSFTVTPTNAIEYYYLVSDIEKDFTADEVKAGGIKGVDAKSYTVENLAAATKSYVYAVAIDSEGDFSPVVSEIFTTLSAPSDSKASIVITPGEITESTITFTLTPKDAVEYFYILNIGQHNFTAEEISADGLQGTETLSYTEENLKGFTEYYVYAVAIDSDGKYSDIVSQAFKTLPAVIIAELSPTSYEALYYGDVEGSGFGSYCTFMSDADDIIALDGVTDDGIRWNFAAGAGVVMVSDFWAELTADIASGIELPAGTYDIESGFTLNTISPEYSYVTTIEEYSTNPIVYGIISGTAVVAVDAAKVYTISFNLELAGMNQEIETSAELTFVGKLEFTNETTPVNYAVSVKR